MSREWRQRLARWINPSIPQLSAAADRWQPAPQETGELLIEYLRAPADIAKVRARRRPPPSAQIVSFEAWMRARTASHPVLSTLPPAWHNPAAHLSAEARRDVISRLSTVPAKPPSRGDTAWPNGNVEEVRVWGEPDHRAALFDDVRAPSQPLEEDNAPTEMTESARREKSFRAAITGLLRQESE